MAGRLPHALYLIDPALPQRTACSPLHYTRQRGHLLTTIHDGHEPGLPDKADWEMVLVVSTSPQRCAQSTEFIGLGVRLPTPISRIEREYEIIQLYRWLFAVEFHFIFLALAVDLHGGSPRQTLGTCITTDWKPVACHTTLLQHILAY